MPYQEWEATNLKGRMRKRKNIFLENLNQHLVENSLVDERFVDQLPIRVKFRMALRRAVKRLVIKSCKVIAMACLLFGAIWGVKSYMGKKDLTLTNMILEVKEASRNMTPQVMIERVKTKINEKSYPKPIGPDDELLAEKMLEFIEENDQVGTISLRKKY